MKKQMKFLVAALAATAIATPAFAMTVETKGFVEIRGQADHNLVNGSDRLKADNDRTGVDQRLRLWTEAAADENVKGVFAIEYDGWWGDTQAGDIGSDGKGQLEVKHMYLDFNLPSANTNVKAGTQYYKIANGYIAGDDASGLTVTTKFGDAAALKFYWVKAVEGDFGVTSDDADFYGAQVDLKAGPMTVSPILAWSRYAKNRDLYFGGFDLAGKFGDSTKMAMTLVKNWGDDSGNPNVRGTDIDGIAAYLGLFTKAGTIDLSAEGAYICDDGRTSGEFVDGSGPLAGTSSGNWGLSNPTEIMGGGRYDRRGGIGQGAGAGAAGGIGDLYTLNQAYVKLGLGVQTSEKTKLNLYLAHLQEGAGGTTGGLVVLGQEAGAYYDITLAKGLTYGLMGSYLYNDDFGGVGNDNVWKLGNALTYKF